jgi:hypothetical protein
MKKQDDQVSLHSDNKLNQPSAGKERKNPKMRSVHPFPYNPQKDHSVKPDDCNNPINTQPGVDEPKKNDPTHTDEPPSIFL